MSNKTSTVDFDRISIIIFFLSFSWRVFEMVLSLFGIVGNILTMIILLSPSMRITSTNIYLRALSCSNILFLLICILDRFMVTLLKNLLHMRNSRTSSIFFLIICLSIEPISHTVLLSIIYLTIAVSIDRLISVKYPLKAKQMLTRRRTLIAILFIYIFSIVYCIPFWLERRYDPELKECRLTNIGLKIYKYISTYIYIPVVFLIPLIILTCVNIAIMQNLIAKKRRKKTLGVNTNKNKQAENYIILMPATVIIFFVLYKLPLSIYFVLYAIDPYDPKIYFKRLSLMLLGEFLLILNASTNFLIHCFFGEKFREILIEFILHIIPNYNRQRNLQLLEQKQRISSRNSSITNHLKISTDLNNISINQQELSPLMTISEEISVIKEDISFKPSQNYNLHRCANDKRMY